MAPQVTAAAPMTRDARRVRLRIHIRGAVQGVGFRPFIYRLATGLGLDGWVSNSAQGVFIEAEGRREQVEALSRRIPREAPPLAIIQSLEGRVLDPVGYAGFAIRTSDEAGEKRAFILPDIATCPECLRDILDPRNRRYGYPFTNCTNCGPRFSIVEALPYDRCHTTMKRFAMCDRCRQEYEDPLDRRFHAQPNACPRCGPQLALWGPEGSALATRDDALLGAATALREGAIVAVKGLGGFHLMVDARREEAVRRLRLRKRREEKPLALMYPSLDSVRADCEVSALEERLLVSPESPIVLLRRRSGRAREAREPAPPGIAASVAPGNPSLGVMLPYTPLHHLLMLRVGVPVVATSGNLSEEPICTDERDALERLAGIADLFLVHDRPIARPVDDSVVRAVAGRELVLRRSRGYAPLPIPGWAPRPCVLAVGGHLKNTVAACIGAEVFLSQHVGDLETDRAVDAFRGAVGDLEDLYEVRPAAIACDAHPDYHATRFARDYGGPVIRVQHHFAHVVSCMAEHGLAGPVLGVSWDGTGYGLDGTIWGGEFLRATPAAFRRVAHLRRFRLPGGEKAIAEPRRAALGLLWELLGDAAWEMRELAPLRAFRPAEARVLQTMLQRAVNAPATSSAGRLFDAVAALLGLSQRASFEGQAAMALEFALDGAETEEAYPFAIASGGPAEEATAGTPRDPAEGRGHGVYVVDWAPIIRGVLDDLRSECPVGTISAKFHNSLAETIVGVAHLAGEEVVVLTGGCFQNRYLTERTIHRLAGEGFRPYWHRRVPPGDGGIAVGQAVAAAAALAGR